MDDKEKLKHLLGHWIEHNQEHVRTYREWAEKAGLFGNQELSRVLDEIAEGTERAEELFKKALSII
jgi:hypothetical protein